MKRLALVVCACAAVAFAAVSLMGISERVFQTREYFDSTSQFVLAGPTPSGSTYLTVDVVSAGFFRFIVKARCTHKSQSSAPFDFIAVSGELELDIDEQTYIDSADDDRINSNYVSVRTYVQSHVVGTGALSGARATATSHHEFYDDVYGSYEMDASASGGL